MLSEKINTFSYPELWFHRHTNRREIQPGILPKWKIHGLDRRRGFRYCLYLANC